MNKETLEQRRQIALRIANQCLHILKEEFNAKEAILFGSLRGDSPWHGRSDLDLAVKGLSDQELDTAYSKLEQIIPSWLKFDLVNIKEVSEHFKTRIYQEEKMPTHKYLALKMRLNDEMIALDRNFEALKTALEQSRNVPEIFVTPTLASYITDFYTGCERIAERIAVVIDGGLPKSENWHEILLKQMSETGGENRPPLWESSLLLELDELRRFRHLNRHRYNVELTANRVIEIAKKIEPIFNQIKQSLDNFNHWLEKQP